MNPFTQEDLQKVKAQVKEGLEWELMISKKLYNGPGFTKIEYYNEYLLNKASSEIRLSKGETELKELYKLLKVGKNDIGSRILLDGRTKPVGRTDYFTEAVFTREWFEPKESVPNEVVRIFTKKRLNRMFMPKHRNEHNFYLECKLMEQFKLGNLTMEQVIEGSMEECQI